MFRLGETKRLKKLIDPEVSVSDVLDELEIKSLANSKHLVRIKDQLHIPTHNRSKKTITLVKVITQNFDFQNFLFEVLDSVNPEAEIRIGFSFLMTANGTPSYVFSIPARPINDKCRIIRDDEDKKKLISFFKGLSYSDLLQSAFQLRNTNNPFSESGYRPEKLVCATFWICKWAVP